MRTILTATAAAAVLTGSTMGGAPSPSQQCRGLHGQFVPCSTAQIVVLCRDAKTKAQAKCGAAGSERAPQVLRHFNG